MPCKHEYEFDRSCGAYVCWKCDDHRGLARCYCGWSSTSPGQGVRELVEMGENLDEAED